MAATDWEPNPMGWPTEEGLLRAADEELLRRDSDTLIRLAQGVFSYTDGSRHRCDGCYRKPLRIAQMALEHKVPSGFIQSAVHNWERDFGGWHPVNGMEAFARRYEHRVCEDCGEDLP